MLVIRAKKCAQPRKGRLRSHFLIKFSSVAKSKNDNSLERNLLFIQNTQFVNYLKQKIKQKKKEFKFLAQLKLDILKNCFIVEIKK